MGQNAISRLQQSTSTAKGGVTNFKKVCILDYCIFMFQKELWPTFQLVKVAGSTGFASCTCVAAEYVYVLVFLIAELSSKTNLCN